MKRKIIIMALLIVISLITITTISAAENNTDTIQINECKELVNVELNNNSAISLNQDNNTLSKSNEIKETQKATYYYNSTQNKDIYIGNLIQAKTLKMYYKDGSKFKVKVVNAKGKPARTLITLFKSPKSFKMELTNSKGIAYFDINYPAGKYNVGTMIIDPDSDDYIWSPHTIIVKSTIPTKTLKKSIKQKNKEFSIKFLNKKGKVLKNKKVKVKVKSKTHTLKTNNKGIAKIKINSLKVGKHTITAINSVTKEKREITVKITK